MSSAQTSGDRGIERNVVKFAEQLGWLAGTVQAKADGWLDDPKLNARIGRIRDSATKLLAQLSKASGSKGSKGSRQAAEQTARTVARVSAMVAAPGKKHRPAPARMRGVKHSDERIAKSMRQQHVPQRVR